MLTGRTARVVGVWLLIAASVAACTDATEPELEGKWGGPEATLLLSALGGSVEYACGAGTIDPGWRLERGGRWTATGQHSIGGGPLPPGGRPPHRAVYTGTLSGDVLTFTVVIPDQNLTLGPFRVVRGAEGVSEMCL